MPNSIKENWKESNLQVFWGEVAPCDHVVQMYENDLVFLNSLEGFVGSGLIAGDSIIIFATNEHLAALSRRLTNQGFDISLLVSTKRYIAIDANEALSCFMIDQQPDETLFDRYINALFKRVSKNGRKVRAFGEMVALLWQQGYYNATLQLEHLWNKLHKKDQFTLFCAYPKPGFPEGAEISISAICSAHTKVINGDPQPSTEICYRTAS